MRSVLRALRELWADVRAQKLRTAMTILGIAWGTVAVVVLLAFGTGLETHVIKRFHGLGDRIVILFGGETTKPFAGFGNGRDIRLREEDATLLAAQIPEIVLISPEYSWRGVAGAARLARSRIPTSRAFGRPTRTCATSSPTWAGGSSTRTTWISGGASSCWAMRSGICCSRTNRETSSDDR